MCALSAHAGLLSFDSFEDYVTSANIHGQTGGSGWSGAWAVQSIGGGASGVATVSSTSIIYTHGGVILGGGNSLQLSSTSNGTRRNVFPSTSTAGDDFYVSFVFRFSGTVFAGWQALDGAADINNDSIGLVNTNGSVGARVDNATGSSASGLVPQNTTGFMVVQYTGWTGTNYSTVNVWINPAAGAQSASAPSATYTDSTPNDGGGSAGFLGVYVRTLIDAGENFLIDDLRVGTDWTSVTALTTAAAAPAPAADWFLKRDQPVDITWTTLTDWTEFSNGTGGSPTSFSSSEIFDTNNHFLRGPFGTGTYVFGGGELRLTGTAGTLALKTYNGGTSEFARVVGSGGRVLNYQSGVQNVRFTEFENKSGVRFSSATSRGLRLYSDVMLGAGETRVIDAGVFQPDVDDAWDYVGDLVVQSGSVDFVVPFDTGGRVIVEPGTGTVKLNASVTANGFIIKGKSLAEGTYSFAALQALYPTVFTAGVPTASVTVRAPATWYLKTDQPPSHDWSTLADWNEESDGSGADAVIINPYDIYLAQGAGRRVRTPVSSSTFPGGALALGSGAKLLLQSSVPAVSTVSALETNGTTSIGNGVSGVVQSLTVGDWAAGSGTATLAISSANGLNLNVGRLSGAGALRTQGGGAVNFALGSGRNFTGVLQHDAGVLTLGSRLFTDGSFAVGSGASVTLNNHAGFFTGVTVAGTPLAAGFHSQAALNAAFPARFPTSTGSGFLAVFAPDTTGPAHMFGVNLAGAEFNDEQAPGVYNTHYTYPTAAEFDYYHAKGLDLIRLPFRWERIQHTLNGSLNAAELARMDAMVGHASARGMKIILDMHNYARRWQGGSEVLIGTGSVTLAHFGDVWRRLADHYKGNSAIYGYGIMNEPYSTGGTWPVIAQTAVDAIRTVDLGTYVIVGGDTFSNAVGWRAKNPNLDIQDPVGRLIYEAHCYFDGDHSGRYQQTYDAQAAYPMIGVDRVKEFVEWLQEKGVKGFIGEYGVPADDSRWNTVLDNFLAYLDANGVSGTYWAGGPWWGTYILSCEPTSNFTVDRPQMSVLEQYP